MPAVNESKSLMKSLLTLKSNQKSEVRYVSSSIFTYNSSAETHHESKEEWGITEPLVTPPQPSPPHLPLRNAHHHLLVLVCQIPHCIISSPDGSSVFGSAFYCSCHEVPINLPQWLSPPRTVFIQLWYQFPSLLMVTSRSQSLVSNRFSKESHSIIYFLVLLYYVCAWCGVTIMYHVYLR